MADYILFSCEHGGNRVPPRYRRLFGGHWHTFDPRNNVPRIGRISMARGRDAANVAIGTTFGPNVLKGFRVWTDIQEALAGVVIESTYNGYWMVDGRKDAGYRVHLAHSAAIRKYEGLKRSGDFADAAYLAQPLRLGLLAEA